MRGFATSVAASFRGHRDLAVGNVVGSNVFNALGVLGAGAAFSGGIPLSPARWPKAGSPPPTCPGALSTSRGWRVIWASPR